MSLKLGSTAYEYLENGWNVGVVKDGAQSGFVGYKTQQVIEESFLMEYNLWVKDR